MTFSPDRLIVNEKIDIAFGGYKNSFRPEAIIKFKDNSIGTNNDIIIKPNSGVIIFTSIMMLFVFIAGISLLLTNKVQEGLSVVSVFTVFMYLLATVSFNIELSKMELFVDYLLETNYIV